MQTLNTLMLQVPADASEAVAAKLKASEAAESKGPLFPGATRATMVGRGDHLPGELKFGEVKQRALDDGMSLRQKLAANS
jgi:hypothetical protein